jgi:hypothetical protein
MEAGYLIVRTRPHAEWRPTELLPEQILSASPDIGWRFPGPYALAWSAVAEAERTEEFERVGLPAPLRASATAWATENFEKAFGWPGVFYTLPEALAARERFLSGVPGIHVIGLGLPERYLESFLEAAQPAASQPGFAPMGSSGYYDVASERRPLAPGGQLLGFELVVTDFGQIVHSWLCNSLEEDCFQALGVRPAAYGLLSDWETAERCYAEISKDSVGKEPGLWLPWALVGYMGPTQARAPY